MAIVKRMTYFKTQIEDKPGALLAIANDLKEKNLDLIGLKGVSHMQHGDVLIIPRNPEKVRIAWNATGKLLEEGTLFFVTGVNKTGALAASLDTLAKNDVNIVALEAGAIGGRYGAFLWVSPQDVERTAQILAAT